MLALLLAAHAVLAAEPAEVARGVDLAGLARDLKGVVEKFRVES